MIKKPLTNEKYILLLYIPFSFIIIFVDYICQEVSLSVFLIWVIVFSNIKLFNFRKDFLDPRVFFSAFFGLYHTWYPLSILLGRDALLFPMDFHVLWQTTFFSLCSLIFFINFINFFNAFLFKKQCPLEFNYEDVKSWKSEKIMILISFLIVIVSFYFISSSGMTSKSDVNTNGGALKLISYYSFFISTALILIRMVRLGNQGFFKDLYFISFCFLTVLYVGFTGERDVLFRFLICTLLIYTYREKNFGVLKIASLLALASVIVPISQVFKAVFLSGFNGINFEFNSIFSNEFISTSRNLYALIYFDAESNSKFIFTDIARGILPSYLTELIDLQSSSQWFNSNYRVSNGFDGRAGWGFGLVPQGFLVGGFFGAFIVMGISAFIVTSLFFRASRSVYWFVLYILALTVLVYAMRADLANLISQTFKINGVSIFIVFITHYVFIRLKR